MAEAAQFQGTRSAPARQWLRRTVAGLLGAPLLVGLLQIPAASPSQAAPAASTASAVDVSIDSMTPTTPTDDDTLTVKGTVTNKSKSTITDAHVGLRLGQTLDSRSAIDTASQRTGYAYGADGTEVPGKYQAEIDKLPSGITENFSLSIPVEDLDLRGDGIYQLGVSLSGQTPGRSYDQVLGIERTFLPWQPDTADGKTGISYLWPLISTSHLAARTDSDAEQTRTLRDDSLAAEIAPGGRLQQMVSLGKNLPVTWVVDPDLLATVDAMTKNYKIANPDGTTTAGKHQAVAKQWLKDFQEATEDREVVALPFADPDLASLAHRGKDVGGALGQLKSATDLASSTVETVLGRKPRTDFAWPAEGAIDSSVVDVATSAGAHNVITRSDSLRERGGLPYSPTAARPIGRGNTAVSADARLSTAFRGDLSRAEDSTLAVQQFLAQTLMVTMQAPGKQRSIVVAPQRMPTATQARAMAEAITGLEEERWSQAKDLSDAAKAKPDPGATTQVPGAGAYPRSLRKQELPTEAFRDARTTQSSLDRFQVILSQPDRVVTPVGNAIMREMSNSWRGSARDATNYRRSVQDYLTDLSQSIQLVQKSTQTLSGRSATIPVTVQNNLVQGIEGMKLVLTSGQPNRLEVKQEQAVQIEGGHSQSVKFDTTAHANGTAWVTARLYTKDGMPYGAPMTFRVKVTEITSTVMLVIAGGVLLLVLAGIRMYTQRKRAAARGATDSPDSPESSEPGESPHPEQPEEPAPDAESTEESAQESPQEEPPAEAPASQDTEPDASDSRPEQQGDATPDTGPESGEASGMGEKVDR
ncbi:DUF6049 family protein [Streptomyces sp. NPDC048639]|uniref:DUF6049 family protein n=1 Tax=Streptomyces sp. NPDC048639 TaxID=3365581 RepID=UPI00371F8B22